MRSDRATLDRVLSRARHLLLDFDGPICSIFGGVPAGYVAARLHLLVTRAELAVPAPVAASSDPFDVLRYVAAARPELTVPVEAELHDLEVRAARSARPTPYARDLIEACHRTGRSVCVVSNNARAAVHDYLSDHRLAHLLAPIIGRDDPDPALLKPNPYLILCAVAELGARPDECLLVGDSPSDVKGARYAGVSSAGYANRPGKARLLAASGADLIITGLSDLLTSMNGRRQGADGR